MAGAPYELSDLHPKPPFPDHNSGWILLWRGLPMTLQDKKLNDALHGALSERWPRAADGRTHGPWLSLIIYISSILVISAALFASANFEP
jgi:hypothetical protein